MIVVLLTAWVVSGMCVLGLRSDPVRSNMTDIRPEESALVLVFVLSTVALVVAVLFLLLRFLSGGAE